MSKIEYNIIVREDDREVDSNIWLAECYNYLITPAQASSKEEAKLEIEKLIITHIACCLDLKLDPVSEKKLGQQEIIICSSSGIMGHLIDNEIRAINYKINNVAFTLILNFKEIKWAEEKK